MVQEHGPRSTQSPTNAVTRDSRKPRVFVDFTLIDYKTRVTGIPRVAYAYLEEGYALMDELGCEVLPVYVKDGVLRDARPFLLWSNLRRLRRRPGPAALLQFFRSCLYFVLHVSRLAAVSCITPVFALLGAVFSFEFFDLWRNVLRAGYRRGYFLLKDRINGFLGKRLDFQPGDVLFMPAYWHDTPPGYYMHLRRQGLVLCPLVHDILPITHAEHYESPWREQFKRWVYEVLSNSDHIYYVSDFTRASVEAVNAHAFHRALAAGTVLHHGSDFAGRHKGEVQAGALVRRLRPLEELPTFLMVGSIEPKKNHLAVLAEFEALWRRGIEARLVIVGGGGWKDEAIRKTLQSCPYLHALLFWRESVADDELEQLYREARALIQASEAEGFGLPVIEALALGTPVLANDIPVFREVAGPHAIFFDVHHEGDLGAKVEQLLRGQLQPTPGFSWPGWNERARVLYSDLMTRSPAGATRTGPTHAARAATGSGGIR